MADIRQDEFEKGFGPLPAQMFALTSWPRIGEKIIFWGDAVDGISNETLNVAVPPTISEAEVESVFTFVV